MSLDMPSLGVEVLIVAIMAAIITMAVTIIPDITEVTTRLKAIAIQHIGPAIHTRHIERAIILIRPTGRAITHIHPIGRITIPDLTMAEAIITAALGLRFHLAAVVIIVRVTRITTVIITITAVGTIITTADVGNVIKPGSPGYFLRANNRNSVFPSPPVMGEISVDSTIHPIVATQF